MIRAALRAEAANAGGRYIVLAGHCYYPQGWSDFRGSFDSLDDAIAAATSAYDSLLRASKANGAWWQIVDKTTDKVIEEGVSA